VAFDGFQWRLEQPLPRAAQGEVSVALPASQSLEADIVSALGARSRGENGRLLRAELGPVDRLVVTWQDKLRAASAPLVEVDELLWLRVQPGSVTLKAKWLCQPQRGAVRRFRFAFGHPLRLRGTLRTSDQAEVRMENDTAPAESGRPPTFWLVLDRPRSSPFSIEGEFALLDTSGVGSLRMPPIGLLDVAGIRRRLAVSVDPELDLEETISPDTTRVSPGEFLAHWGGGEERPKAARNVSGLLPSWQLTTRYREPQRSARESLTAVLSPRRADLKYEADLSITGTVFQHRLRVPANVTVDAVSVTEAGQPREARWTSGPGGVVSVFLHDRAGANQRLELRARMSLELRGTWIPPVIRCEDAQTQASLLRIFRRPGIGVEANSKPSASSSGTQGKDHELGRFVGEYSLLEAKRPMFRFRPNPARAALPRMASRVWKDRDRWKLDVVCQLEVREGAIDLLTFEAPASLGVPIDLKPSGRIDIEAVSGESRVIWKYLPDVSLEADEQVRIRVTLPEPPDQWKDFPRVRPLDFAATSEFLALPVNTPGLEGGWKTDGLVRLGRLEEIHDDKLRAQLAELAGDGDHENYRVVRGVDEFNAMARPAETLGQPRAMLAEWKVMLEHGGTFWGEANFDLLPAGLSECELLVPQELQILQSYVEGWPTTLSSVGEGHYRLPLHSRKLPQVIRVVYSGSWDSDAPASRALPAPRLATATIDRSLWRIERAAGVEVTLPEQDHSTLIEADWVCLLAGAEALRNGAERGSAETSGDWYRSRLKRWLADAKRFEQAAMPSDLKRLTKLKNEQEELARKLGLADVFTATQASNSTTASVPSVTGTHELAVVSGSTDAVLYVNSVAHDRAAVWPGAVLAVLFFGGALALWKHVPTQWTPQTPWPQWVVGVVLGVIWWLWIWPSFLGVAIAVASCGMLAYSCWRWFYPSATRFTLRQVPR
jgi:hypothetical protein